MASNQNSEWEDLGLYRQKPNQSDEWEDLGHISSVSPQKTRAISNPTITPSSTTPQYDENDISGLSDQDYAKMGSGIAQKNAQAISNPSLWDRTKKFANQTKEMWQDLDYETPTPKNVGEFAENVPRSTARLAKGIISFAPSVINAVSEGANRALATATSDSGNLGEAWQQFMEPIAETSEGIRQFTGKPLGLYGSKEAKEAWAGDPAGSLAAILPVAELGRRSARAIPRPEIGVKPAPVVEQPWNPVTSPERTPERVLEVPTYKRQGINLEEPTVKAPVEPLNPAKATITEEPIVPSAIEGTKLSANLEPAIKEPEPIISQKGEPINEANQETLLGKAEVETPSPGKPVSASVKEPWEMTRAEHIANRDTKSDEIKTFLESNPEKKILDGYMEANEEAIKKMDFEEMKRTNELYKNPPIPEVVYRGVSHAELENIKKTGTIKSNGSGNFDYENEKSHTLYTGNPGQALAYADGFTMKGHEPSTEIPGYVIEVLSTPEMNRDISKQIVTKESVPAKNITRIIEVRPESDAPSLRKYSEFSSIDEALSKKANTDQHHEAVKQALSEGKPVPPEVLKDYPELVTKQTSLPKTESIAPKEPDIETAIQNEQRNMILSDMQQSLKEGRNYGTEQVNYGNGWENRNIGTSNPPWLNELMNNFMRDTKKGVKKEEVLSTLAKMSDPEAKSLTDKQINIRYHLENVIQDLQNKGHFRNEAEAAHLEGKGYVREKGEIPAYNIDKGDKFVINGEEFTAKEIDESGNVLLKDGTTKKVAPDETVPFEAIKKSEGAEKAPDDFEFGLNQKQPFKEETSDLPGMSYEENFGLTSPEGRVGEKLKGYAKPEVTGDLFSEGKYSKRQNETRSRGTAEPPPTPEDRMRYEARKRAIVEMPELVEIANNLMGKGNIWIKEMLSKKAASGVFKPSQEGKIELKADIFKDPEEAAKVMAHEIGHLVDYMPDKDIKRGNILGRIASLKKHMDSLLEEYRNAPGKILTDADKKRLREEAELLAKESEQSITETIYKDVPKFETLGVDSELILDLMRGVKDRNIAPDLFEHLQRVDGKTKAVIIRQAMKGVIDDQLKQFDQKIQVGTERIAETITKGGIKATKAEIEKLFREKLAEEIQKRRLFEKEVITDELKQLTQLWKPFDPTKSGKYTQYRNSSVELYADAFSVLMNDPELLRKESPTFHRAFFNWLDQKPEVKALYDEIQKRIASDTETLQTRQENIRDSFKRGEEVALANEKQRTEITTSGFLAEVKKALIDTNTEAISRVKQVEKVGHAFEDAENPRYWLEELPYISSEIAGHISGIDNRVLNPLKKDGITIDDVGEYMMLKRIATERSELANPLGHTKETAIKQIENLRQQLGDEKFAKLEEHISNFRKERQGVIKLIEESKMYDRNLMNAIKNSENYATFDVTKYLEERYGRGVSGHIYKQIGTVNEVRNPFIATIMKDAALIRAAEVTKAKRSIAKMFIDNFSDEIKIADTRWNGKYHEPVESRNANEGMVVFLENGKPSAFYLPKEIAESFNSKPYESGMIMRVWQTAMKPLRAVLVSHNPLWMVANIAKDFMGTVTNIHGMTVPKLLNYYKKSFSEAWQDAMKGQTPEVVEEMLKKKMLVIDRQFDIYDSPSSEAALDRMLQSYGKSPVEYQNNVVKPFVKVWQGLGNLGKFTERIGKISGYKYLKEQGTAERKAAHVIRSAVGTPDIYRRGSLHNITNSIFLFSNVGKEGFRSSYEAFKLNPGAYTWKLVKYNIAPKMIYKAAKYGFLGTTLAQICSKVSPYDEENYTVVPLGLTENNKAIYFTIPQSYTGQVVSGLIWNVMEGTLMGKGGAIDYGTGSQPYALNPYISVGLDLATYYMKGQNPYDYFRGQNILSNEEFAAGGIDAAKELGKHTWNELGGSAIHRTAPGVGLVEKQGQSTIEKLLKTYPLNIVGKFVKISNLGEKSSLKSIGQEVEQQEARNSLEKKRRIIESINDSNGKMDTAKAMKLYGELRKEGTIPQTVKFGVFLNQYRRYQSKSEDSPIIDSIGQAKTNLQKAEILREYQKTATPNDYNNLTRQLFAEKLISPNVIQTVNSLNKKKTVSEIEQ